MAKAQKAAGGKTGKAAAKKRVVKVDALGEAHIVASFNNIIISLTNKQGQTISWSSAGKMGANNEATEISARLKLSPTK